MFEMRELLKGKELTSLPQEHQDNLQMLLVKINILRLAYDKPLIVTSGYRSMEEHLAIYANKGITDTSKIPMHSKHLIGAAVDISDPNKELQNWCKDNEELLQNTGIWMEDFNHTPNWVHWQVIPYGSYKAGGSLWFIP